MGTENKDLKKAISDHYVSRLKANQSSCCGPRQSGSSRTNALSGGRAVELYSGEELSRIPENAARNFFGCGNPVATVEPKEGEVVLDLGSGAGLDAFIAAQKVGSKGKVIGIDMTLEMIKQARENAREIGAENVEFRLGEIEQIPLGDNSVDVVISNCVINLSTDKDAVFREAFRVLKPGGRLTISDIVALEKLSAEIKSDAASWASCIAGAIPQNEYLDKIKKAGFARIEITQEVPPVFRGNPKESQRALKGKLISVKVRAVKP